MPLPSRCPDADAPHRLSATVSSRSSTTTHRDPCDLSLRFLIPLLLALGVFAYAAVPLVDSLMSRWFVRDLDIRANLIANTVAGTARAD